MSNIYLSLGIICFFVSILIIVLRYVQASVKQSLEFFLTFSFFFIYQLSRYSVAVVKTQVMREFVLEASDFASFSSCFSLGYAAAQILAGYIISRWNLFGLGILNVLAGISLYGSTLPKSYPNILVMRTITGICFSAGSLGLVCAINNMSKKNFNLVFSTGFFIALKLASMTNFVLGKNYFIWIYLYETMGKIAFLLGLGILVLSFFSKQIAQEKNSVGLIKSIISFFSDIDMILLSIFSALIVAPTYVFQNGWLNHFDIFLKNSIGTCNKFFNDSTAYASILVPAIVAAKGTSVTMLISSVLATIGTLILLFLLNLPYSFIFMIISAICIGIGFASHSVTSMAIIEKFTDARVPMYFAIMNFICMIVGSSVMQKLSGVILDCSNLTYLLLFLCFSTLIAFMSIGFFCARKKP